MYNFDKLSFNLDTIRWQYHIFNILYDFYILNILQEEHIFYRFFNVQEQYHGNIYLFHYSFDNLYENYKEGILTLYIFHTVYSLKHDFEIHNTLYMMYWLLKYIFSINHGIFYRQKLEIPKMFHDYIDIFLENLIEILMYIVYILVEQYKLYIQKYNLYNVQLNWNTIHCFYHMFDKY